MLLVQKFLTNQTFGDLERLHGVEISVDGRHGHKFSLNYSQINSVDSDMLAQQCRGLILSNGRSLNESARVVNGKFDYRNICPGQTCVIAAPIFRFFNHGQGAAANISWTDPTLRVLEKLDGTLCLAHFDQIINEWHVATRSRPEADVPLEFPKYTFRTLFEKALFDMRQVSFEEFCAELNTDNTYCFELTSPFNRIVVKNDQTELHLLAVRNKFTLQESDPSLEIGCLKFVNIVKEHGLSTIDDVINYVNERNPLDHEGVVLRDGNFNRIKVKNASYVALNRCRDSLSSSPRNCLELVLQEKADDVVSFMPDEIAEQLLSIKARVADFIARFEQDYKNININFALRKESDPTVQSWNDQKLFADCVRQSGIWGPPCFRMFSGKASSFKDYISQSKKEGSWSHSFLDSILNVIEFQ